MRRFYLLIVAVAAGLPAFATALPASFPIASADEFAGYSTIDGNADGKTWKYENGACYEGTGTSGAADDYLVLGSVTFGGSGNYALSLQSQKMFMSETFEVCLSPTGTAADAVSVAAFDDVPNFSYGVLTAEFSATPGDYYVMIHATTPQPGISLYVKDIQLSEIAGGEGFTVPFAMVPEAGEVRHFTVTDANKDSKTWFYDTSNQGMAYEYHRDNAADDYLLLPEVEFPAAGTYILKVDARTWGATNTEAFEIRFGQSDDAALLPVVFTDLCVTSAEYTRSVVVNVAEPGNYRMALHCISAANSGKLLTRNFAIEATDQPVAAELPVEFTGSRTLSAAATFLPGFILPENAALKVEVDYTGGPVSVGIANSPAEAAVSQLFVLPAGQASGCSVVNLSQGGIRYISLSGEGTVSRVALSIAEGTETYPLPFAMQPTAEEFNQFIVLNSNNDTGLWSYYEDFGACRYNFSIYNDADDWLILPAVDVPATDNMIAMSMNVRAMGIDKPETFEVWEGSEADPASMRRIYSSPEIYGETFEPLSFTFAPTHSGATFLAVRATSQKNAFHLFLRDFEVKVDARSTAIPGLVTELTAQGAPLGSTAAVVSFAMPLTTAAGEQLAADEVLTATVSSVIASVTVTGAPGETCTATVENGQGRGEISVAVSNAAGEGNKATVGVYTGQDAPSAPENIAVSCSEDNRSMTITWTQPTFGANGGYADPAQMTFVIRHATGSGSYSKVAEIPGTEPLEFTYTLSGSAPLDMHYLSVNVVNIAGEYTATSGKGLVLGQPYTVPSVEEFEGGEMNLKPLSMARPDDSYTLDWYFDNPALALPEAKNASGKALMAFTEEAGAARGCVHLPKFDTRSADGARLVLRVYNFPHFAPTRISAETVSGSVEIGEIQPAAQAGWQTYSFPLPEELMNLQWIEPVVDFGFTGEYDDEIWMLDSYGVENYFDRELILREATVHATMEAQQPCTWRFLAANYGREAMEVSTPELNFTTVNGDVVSFPENSDPAAVLSLQPGQSVTLSYDVLLDASMEGDLLYDIVLLADGDGNLDNNFVAGPTRVKVQQEYVVRDLQAVRPDIDSPEVTLTWSAPEADGGLLDCETLEPWDYSAKLGLFTNVDRDAEPTIGYSIATFPGMNAVKGWQVWDYPAASELGFDYSFAGYMASDRSLIVFSPYDYTKAADDWLISPEVVGGTSVSFFARPLSYAYGREKIELLASTTGTAPEDFTPVSTFLTKEDEASKIPYWEDVTFTLPADTRYFAIRYASTDIFGLQLDDLSYTPAQADASALTYTIFRNGEAIASGLSATTFTDNCPDDAEYYVAAEKRYDGLHPLSNRAAVTRYSSIPGVDSSATPTLIGVYNLQGIRVADTPLSTPHRLSRASDFGLTPGLYLLRYSDGTSRKALLQ